MMKQLNIRTLLFVLIAGEMIIMSAGILGHMTTDKIALMIVAFAGIWLIFILVTVWVDRIVQG